MIRLAAGLLLWTAGAQAADFERIEVQREKRIYRVQAVAEVNAGFDAVRAVVTDYRHMHWITGAVLEAKVLERPAPGTAIVFVKTRACFGIFCKTIEQTQEADAREPERVVFISIPEKSDVRQGRSEWRLTRVDERRTRLAWDLLMEPDFWVPPLIGPGMIRSGLEGEGRDMINGIEKLAREREQRR